MGGNMRAFILLAVLALAYGERIKGTFEIPDYAAFKAKWNKSYTADENDVHMAAYLKNVEFINNHNAEYDQGKHTFWCGVNEWSDMTDAEYEARNNYVMEPIPGPVRNGDPSTAPDAVDWRQQGAVNGIKNQGQCGSCWAFSAVCALEGQWAIHQGSLPDCAEQQLVSCDPSSHGCSGGWPSKSYNYIAGQGSAGIVSQSAYPYTASDSSSTSPVAQLLLPAVDPALLVPVRELFRRLSVMLDPSPSVSVLLPLPSDSTPVVSLMTPHVEPASTTLLPVLDMTPTRTTGL